MVYMAITHGTVSGYTNGKCRCDECKQAHREKAAEYKAANRERINAKRRADYAEDPRVKESLEAWRRANPEKVKEYDRRKREKHRDRIREYHRARYLLSREAFIARAAKWKKENPEAARASAARSRAKHGDEHRAAARERARRNYAADPQKFKDRFNTWAQSSRGRAWFTDNRARRRGAPFTEEALAWVESLVDPLCTYCGEPANSIDHIVPIINGGTSERENLTPACMDCNRRKSKMSVESFLKTLEKNDV
jgi:5-methylcytosine-specific restriction endonuclease McrA